jgi:hypothetical protein
LDCDVCRFSCITDPEVVPFVDKFIEELDVDNIYDDYFRFDLRAMEESKNQRDLRLDQLEGSQYRISDSYFCQWGGRWYILFILPMIRKKEYAVSISTLSI